jgi:hypothetical protein
MQSSLVRLALTAAFGWSAAVAVAQTVKPPPLPPGSNLVRPEAGLNVEERKRYVRAHHHKLGQNVDYTRDDSIAPQGAATPAARAIGPAPSAGVRGGTAAGRAPGAAGPRDLGGAGTGPAREQTGKGASSYFYDQDKK